ncbi:MAG: GIY-YIG nuclease family protein [Flammeovirgaceae bacterium]|nr:GIY-YIG nuclease family protein [Flammeovirgaceae bacterium]
MSRKIIPGLHSYSLGRLAESLGIKIENRHRAFGDAEATAKIFDILTKRDTTGVIVKALKRNSGETILPPNLPKDEFDKLPAKPGVYYFLDAHGQVIYVGKAINIKKRISGHFTGEAREWNRSNIRNEIHHITYELTGNELIALLLESQEIRRLWPKYNLAQKYKTEEWGIFAYEDRSGYLRFAINQVSRGARPLISFTSKGDAWNFMWGKIKSFDLCPKLCGLQMAKGPCLNYQAGSCSGACTELEKANDYNERAQSSVDSFFDNGDTLAIVGKGRKRDEQSIVLVEKGNYLGYGFVDKNESIADFESAKNFVSFTKEQRAGQNLINSWLLNPRENELITFDKKPQTQFSRNRN